MDNPLSGHIQEATNWCLSLALVFLSLPSSFAKNNEKMPLGENKEKTNSVETSQKKKFHVQRAEISCQQVPACHFYFNLAYPIPQWCKAILSHKPLNMYLLLVLFLWLNSVWYRFWYLEVGYCYSKYPKLWSSFGTGQWAEDGRGLSDVIEKAKTVLNRLLVEIWMLRTLPESVSKEVGSSVRKPTSSQRTLKSSWAGVGKNMNVKDASVEGSKGKEGHVIGP